MRVFISYGHDPNEPLVQRLKTDIERSGHDVWIDKAEIKAGDDWRASIFKGLTESSFALAFLSKHATRDPGVCLDEIGIALDRVAIAPVLVEPEKDVRPPVTLGHIQWLDMSDWRKRKDGAPVAWETWYREKLQTILDLLANPSTECFAGDIKELRTCLQPIDQSADIPPLIRGFHGREWLLRRVLDWRTGVVDQRMFWLIGSPGSGKSAFSAWITHFGRANVIALNLCHYNLDDRRDPLRVIRTLAFQIACRLPDYRLALLDYLRQQDPDGSQIRAIANPGDLFERLLTQRLRFLIDGGRREDRFVMLIDGLDETISNGRSELTEVLVEEVPKLPDWIGLMVTSRPEPPIEQQLKGVEPHWIRTGDKENLDDLRAYTASWLAARKPAADAGLVEKIVSASEGNFLYLRKLREAVEVNLLDLNAPGGLPGGLSGLYQRWFQHRFPDTNAYRQKTVPALEVLAAAEHPVPEEVLSEIFGWSDPELAAFEEALGSLLQRRDIGLAPFHKSLRDWLVDRHAAGSRFVVDRPAGGVRLGDELWRRLVALVDRPGVLPDNFTLAELPLQVSRLADAMLLEKVSGTGSWVLLAQTIADIIKILRQRMLWGDALAWCRLVIRLSGVVGPTGLPVAAWALGEQGAVEAVLGKTSAALQSHRESLAIFELLTSVEPTSVEWQRDVSVSYEELGNLQVESGRLSEALQSYRNSFAIRDHLTKADPTNARWQRDLSVAHSKIGNVQMAQGHLAEALESYDKDRAIAARLAKLEPRNTERQRDLSVSYNKVGDVQVAQGQLGAALQSFRDSQAILERLAKADPNNAGWQRDLSVSYIKVGDVQVAQGQLAAALQSYRVSLAIADHLTKAVPTNARWQRDLFGSYVKVGDAQLASDQVEEARSSAANALAKAQELNDKYPGDPQYVQDLETAKKLCQRVEAATQPVRAYS